MSKPTQMRNLVKFLLTAATSIGFAVGAGSSVLAESFVVDGNKALNTNNKFAKIDGQPRMSIWTYSSSDQDQQFDRLPGNRGGILLKQRSTGKCLNAHYLYNGGPVNVWNCNANDPDQNFNINSLGSGYVQIKRAGTNLCVDSPTRNNGGKVHLWSCNPSNPNQRFKNLGVAVTSGPRLPWGNGVTGSVSQTIHTDGYGLPALDIALSAGVPVVAPVDVTVVSQCNAGNNHRAMKLRDSQGRYYSLIHVTTSNIWVGKTYKQGEQIGVIAGDKPWNSCAKSRGPHLHMGLPSNPSTLGGYTLGSTTPLYTRLTAR